MLETTLTRSGLVVACENRNEQEIDAALKQLDSSLFLDKDRRRPGAPVFFCVRQYLGPTQAPLHILDWVEADGTPKPLSSGIIYEVESRKRFAGRNLVEEADEANTKKREAAEAEADAEREEAHNFYARRLRLGSAANSRRFFPVTEKRVRRPTDERPRGMRS